MFMALKEDMQKMGGGHNLVTESSHTAVVNYKKGFPKNIRARSHIHKDMITNMNKNQHHISYLTQSPVPDLCVQCVDMRGHIHV